MFKYLLAITLISSAFAGKGDKSLGGCGIGWQIAPKHSMVSVTTRAFTNVWVFSSATTTGTSGCEKHKIARQEKLDQHFLEASFDEVLASLATGRGEINFVFSRALGCHDSVSGQFAEQMKKSYSKLEQKSYHPSAFLGQIKQEIQNNPVLDQHCQITI